MEVRTRSSYYYEDDCIGLGGWARYFTMCLLDSWLNACWRGGLMTLPALGLFSPSNLVLRTLNAFTFLSLFPPSFFTLALHLLSSLSFFSRLSLMTSLKLIDFSLEVEDWSLVNNLFRMLLKGDECFLLSSRKECC